MSRRRILEQLEVRYALTTTGLVAHDIVQGSDVDGPLAVHAADLDQDGDVDFLSS